MPTGVFNKFSRIRNAALFGGVCVGLLAVLAAVALHGPTPAAAAINPAEILGLDSPERKAARLDAQMRKAAATGERQAKTNLACHLFRQRTAGSEAEARTLLEQVAMQGDIEAMIHLSKFVYAGVGATASEANGDEVAAVSMAQQAFDALQTGAYTVASQTGELTLASNQHSMRGMDIQGWLWLISPTCGPGRAGMHIGTLIKDDNTQPHVPDAILADDDVADEIAPALQAQLVHTEG